jgi:predicted DNA-binding transcriptional regulator AlpA
MPIHPALADLGIAPRLLTREQAAAYCGLSVYGFSEWVKTTRLPGPIPGTIRWDRKAIDAALDVLSRIDANSEGEALDQWKAKHHARRTERNSSS